MNDFLHVHSRSLLILGLALPLPLGLAGCARAPASAPAPAAPTPVLVSQPIEREINDYADFTGRTAAVESVEIRARVTGYLDKINFKEGTLVKKGDVLFEIDPRTYQAALAYTKAEVERLKSQRDLDSIELHRSEDLMRRGAETRENYDRAAAKRSGSGAALVAAEAQLQRGDLDVGFTKVTAPISGRIGRTLLTVGNLVQSGDQNGGTLLTTLVSVDPMYVYFDVDEHTLLRVRQLIREGKAKSARDAKLSVTLGLANEEGHPHQGAIDFVDNQVNPRTGTLRLRGVFPNKEEALTPGLFARVRVPIGEPHQALLITERAIDTDQGQKIVYVVNSKDEVTSRPVRLGANHGGLRVIEDGLRPSDRVVVVGLQQIRPGAVVAPKLVSMPISGAESPQGTPGATKPAD
ncbi:efflux RND transporter periplasmic adaptor subunit [Singulisphaera acidiphila]|uniref:RND family efflux transporter, MFP subunit n=1 Tax=Singulisphaera acidiphila (strain ATCC BAA-1392 / DSM 18658 / VKM B-2454 / MOB10) TaxID=886293 RepID=L0DGV8_SINAD|nr:efflux RND transporter periplasmic adaptor subunit [Singulisphaera acidiphila]AGA28090.1 RND family efflux transporter, MFP subunit [Singulisphaera acidiphila DSM 18658]